MPVPGGRQMQAHPLGTPAESPGITAHYVRHTAPEVSQNPRPAPAEEASQIAGSVGHRLVRLEDERSRALAPTSTPRRRAAKVALVPAIPIICSSASVPRLWTAWTRDYGSVPRQPLESGTPTLGVRRSTRERINGAHVLEQVVPLVRRTLATGLCSRVTLRSLVLKCDGAESSG